MALPPRRLGRLAASNAEALAGWVLDSLATLVAIAGGGFLTNSGNAVLSARFAYRDIDWSITGFWLCVVAGPVLIYCKYKARKAAAESVEQRIADERDIVLQSTTELLASAAATQGALHEAYTEALRRPLAALAPTDAVQLLAGDIRIALSSITALVVGVEPARPGAQFAANLMCYSDIDPQLTILPPRVQEALVIERDKRIADQKGVLFLDASLSACTEVESGIPDPNLHDLAFYIPRHPVDETANGALRMLPGAPFAFVYRQMIATNPTKLIQLCRDGSHLVSKTEAERLELYFRSNAGRNIRSIVCHPLMGVEGRRPEAVLNIHSNYDGMLKDPDRRRQLYYLLRPWTLVIVKLLNLFAACEGLANSQRGIAPPAEPLRQDSPREPSGGPRNKRRGKKGRGGRGRR